MKKFALLLAAAASLNACGGERSSGVQADSYNIDTGRISVSGLSSGAYMAGQLHLAHSKLFGGIAILGGGPYYCAQASISNGIGPCTKGGELGGEHLLSYAREMATAGRIDDLANIADDSVWIFHGRLDEVVSKDASDGAASFYEALIDTGTISYTADIDVVHGLPTNQTGLPCDTFGEPYIHACNYDAAGKWLSAIYGSLSERTETTTELRTLEQIGGENAEMLESAFLYVPASCASGASCGLHVAFHGCRQSTEFIGDAFAAGSGLNEWAETNHLLVLYPQVGSSNIAPMNPHGCWDWWGYTNDDYATRSGPQIMVIKAMIDTLAGRTL